jgi:hypothetical protein
MRAIMGKTKYSGSNNAVMKKYKILTNHKMTTILVYSPQSSFDLDKLVWWKPLFETTYCP